ncbi:MAG: hypothetical protein ABSG91_26015, partial [Syntrophobacteraceae bacterium]
MFPVSPASFFEVDGPGLLVFDLPAFAPGLGLGIPALAELEGFPESAPRAARDVDDVSFPVAALPESVFAAAVPCFPALPRCPLRPKLGKIAGLPKSVLLAAAVGCLPEGCPPFLEFEPKAFPLELRFESLTLPEPRPRAPVLEPGLRNPELPAELRFVAPALVKPELRTPGFIVEPRFRAPVLEPGLRNRELVVEPRFRVLEP